MSEPRDHYKVLQVDPAAEPGVITAAFRALAKRLHPDRDASDGREDRMAELNRAYAVLRDPDQRRAYDAERALRPGTRHGATRARSSAQPAAAEEEPRAGDGSSRLNFGRHAGSTLREIAARDREYLDWLRHHSSGIRYRREIDAILKERAGGGEQG